MRAAFARPALFCLCSTVFKAKNYFGYKLHAGGMNP